MTLKEKIERKSLFGQNIVAAGATLHFAAYCGEDCMGYCIAAFQSEMNALQGPNKEINLLAVNRNRIYSWQV